ncbi:hypothetical protein BDM02DRAFT_3133013 [Thelephora ganbajun]|uniref:Uncharacterized protein n=1 Tax=Thelephora ganbajun TaxID=370292 RepID=A0ACB6YZP4_THEGA|nr:hypothetical protein BDM02DRAFT_3133013 [Thelephora ganbajun]
MLASSLDLVTVAHNERLGRLESRCFEQERELGELRVRMLELELAWEQRELPASSGYISAAGEEVVVEEGVGERVAEEEIEMETGYIAWKKKGGIQVYACSNVCMCVLGYAIVWPYMQICDLECAYVLRLFLCATLCLALLLINKETLYNDGGQLQTINCLIGPGIYPIPIHQADQQNFIQNTIGNWVDTKMTNVTLVGGHSSSPKGVGWPEENGWDEVSWDPNRRQCDH